MGRLIDVDALPDHKFLEVQCHDFSDGSAYRQGWNDAIDAIVENEPPVDAVPVRHGRWKRKIVDCGFNADWVCSQCEQKYSDNPIMWEPKEGRRE